MRGGGAVGVAERQVGVMPGGRRNVEEGAKDGGGEAVKVAENGTKDDAAVGRKDDGKKDEYYSNCRICLGTRDYDSIVLCDRCDRGFHQYCLNPPMEAIPAGEWICPGCVRAEMKKRHVERRMDRIIKRVRDDLKLVRNLPLKLKAKLLLKDLDTDTEFIKSLPAKGKIEVIKEEPVVEKKIVRKDRGTREASLPVQEAPAPEETEEAPAVSEETEKPVKIEPEAQSRSGRRGARQRPRRDIPAEGTLPAPQPQTVNEPETQQPTAPPAQPTPPAPAQASPSPPEETPPVKTAEPVEPTSPPGVSAPPISRKSRPQLRSLGLEEIASSGNAKQAVQQEPKTEAQIVAEPEKPAPAPAPAPAPILPSITDLTMDGPPVVKPVSPPNERIPALPPVRAELENAPGDPILPPLWSHELGRRNQQQTNPAAPLEQAPLSGGLHRQDSKKSLGEVRPGSTPQARQGPVQQLPSQPLPSTPQGPPTQKAVGPSPGGLPSRPKQPPVQSGQLKQKEPLQMQPIPSVDTLKVPDTLKSGTLSTASRGSRASRKGSDGERSVGVGEAISKPVESSKPPKKMGGSHTSSSNSALERSQKTAKGNSQSLKRRAGKIGSDRRLTPEGNSVADVEEGEEQLSKRHRPLQEREGYRVEPLRPIDELLSARSPGHHPADGDGAPEQSRPGVGEPLPSTNVVERYPSQMGDWIGRMPELRVPPAPIGAPAQGPMEMGPQIMGGYNNPMQQAQAQMMGRPMMDYGPYETNHMSHYPQHGAARGQMRMAQPQQPHGMRQTRVQQHTPHQGVTFGPSGAQQGSVPMGSFHHPLPGHHHQMGHSFGAHQMQGHSPPPAQRLGQPQQSGDPGRGQPPAVQSQPAQQGGPPGGGAQQQGGNSRLPTFKTLLQTWRE